MSDGYDYRRHGGDFPTLRDDEVELLNDALMFWHDLYTETGTELPREFADAYDSVFLKLRNAAAQRKIGPYGG